MAWRLDGTYFESCSCDEICPCTWSAFTAAATLDRCRALLAYHVESGEIDGVDVSGLNFALFLDTPPVMSEGNWRVGVYLDEAASDSQAERLGAVVSGQLGGPLAMLAPLIGEMLGVERAPISYRDDGRGHHVRIGDGVDLGVEDFVAIEGHDPVQLANVFHPSNTTLTVAPARAARLSTFGIDWGRRGRPLFRAVLLGRVNGSPGLARPRPGLATREVAFLLIVAARAWAATIALARGMAGMSGTMGLGLAAFVAVWTLMMAAMMLPSVTPTASLYARTIQGKRAARIAGLVVGYLAVWAAAGLPAFGLAWLAGRLTGLHPGAAHIVAVAVFAVAGLYQLSPLKDRCLAHCRSPLGLLLHYGSYQGRSRDLRVGVHHGGYCLGCCWALMVILIAVGVMNVAVMVGLAALVLTEKVWRWGPLAGRIAGAAALALAVATIWLPWLAPGLHAAPPMMMG